MATIDLAEKLKGKHASTVGPQHAPTGYIDTRVPVCLRTNAETTTRGKGPTKGSRIIDASGGHDRQEDLQRGKTSVFKRKRRGNPLAWK